MAIKSNLTAGAKKMIQQTQSILTTTQVVKTYAKTNFISLSDDLINYIAQKLSVFDRNMQIVILGKIDFYSRSYISDFNKIVKNGGFTDTELYYNGMEIIGNMFRDCNTDSCDLIFADIRACIAFKMIFENFRRFFEVKETDKELFYSEKFAKAYASVNPKIYPDILNNYYIQIGNDTNSDIRSVIFVGDENKCMTICNNAYGDKWQRIRYAPDLNFKQNEKTKEIIEDIKNTERTNSDFETALKEAEKREIDYQKELNATRKRKEQERKEFEKWVKEKKAEDKRTLEEKMAKYNIEPSGDPQKDNMNVAIKELEEIL